MAWIHHRPSWQLPDHAITPRGRYLDRRQVLRGLGLLGAAAVLPGCRRTSYPPQAPLPAATLARFPAPRNPAFEPGRPLTPQAIGSTYNNFYELSTDKAAVVELANAYRHRPWTLEVGGLVNAPRTWDIDSLIQGHPQEERHYRFRCVEAWSATLPWTGFPLAGLLAAADPKPEARYVRFVSAKDPDSFPGQKAQPWYPWPYTEGLTLPEAMNPLTLLATGVYGEPLPGQHGAPVRLVVPWKYGFKNSKAIVRIELVAAQPATLWNTAVPAEYDFWGLVDPNVPHPRWSQASERLIDDGSRIPTQQFNGYGRYVAGLYNDKKRPFGFGV